MKEHRGRIENWRVEFGMVWGNLYGPRRMFDWERSSYDGIIAIHTSRIVKIDARPGGEVETLNSRYTLGKPCTDGVPVNLAAEAA